MSGRVSGDPQRRDRRQGHHQQQQQGHVAAQGTSYQLQLDTTGAGYFPTHQPTRGQHGSRRAISPRRVRQKAVVWQERDDDEEEDERRYEGRQADAFYAGPDLGNRVGQWMSGWNQDPNSQAASASTRANNINASANSNTWTATTTPDLNLAAGSTSQDVNDGPDLVPFSYNDALQIHDRYWVSPERLAEEERAGRVVIVEDRREKRRYRRHHDKGKEPERPRRR
ncbi:hypothetical protein AAE478_000676 [Parahypoxylon ruwenzoriense]